MPPLPIPQSTSVFLSQGKSVFQSSTVAGYPASAAVDGVTADPNNLSHTDYGYEPVGTPPA